MRRKAEAALHGFENFGAAAVEDEAADVSHTEVVVGEKLFDGAAEF